VNAAEICVLLAFTNRLLDKLKEVNPGEYPERQEMVHLFVRILESTAVNYMDDPLPHLAGRSYAARIDARIES
jgi:hypothetical protein